MDTSPTTGSVNSTAAEKQRLAKASLAFNCKNSTFRKLFPEYVEKYNQQQQAEQPVTEQASVEDSQEEKSKPELEKRHNSSEDDTNRVDAPKDRNGDKKQAFPTWLMLLLVSIFGVVMALPLLQL